MLSIFYVHACVLKAGSKLYKVENGVLLFQNLHINGVRLARHF